MTDWVPPPDPNPWIVLNEARADAAAGRFADALAKHVWFHRNAPTYGPALAGVRLSFAISDWVQLAQAYGPALGVLKELRDEADAKVRSASAEAVDFMDVCAINQHLAEDAATVDLFAWLSRNDPALAYQTYPMAEDVLVRTRQYAMCDPHLDPRHTTRDSAPRLVALLVLNGRSAEADRIVAAALKEWPDRRLRAALTLARQGIIPEAYDSGEEGG